MEPETEEIPQLILYVYQRQTKASKWRLDLSLNSETMKLPEENIDEKFCDFGIGDDVLDMAPKTQP